ncbi:MAG: FMN-binding protein [Synergistaceae bacterium]|nr:FMN-binding protein [Synergistaceae bacterium]
MRKIAAAIILLVLAVPAFAAESTYTVKAGISFSQQWGLYIANVIEKDGKISNIVIDRLANGKSSKELHDNYGIKPVSTLGKDWWEQVAYYEDWMLKNGVDAVKYDKDGHAENVDLISGATIGIDDLTLAVKDALRK